MNINRPISFRTKVNIILKGQISFMSIIPVFGLVLSSIILTVIFFGERQENITQREYSKIKTNGIFTRGIITDVDVEYKTTVNGRHPTIFTFSYLKDGENLIGKAKTLEYLSTNTISLGDSVDVKYQDDEAILLAFNPYSIPWYIALLPLLILSLLFIIFFGPNIYRARKKISLYKNGVVIMGEINAVTSSSFSPFSSFNTRLKVHYQYVNTEGQTILGADNTYDITFSNEKKGAPINLLVSPLNSSKSCIYPGIIALENKWDKI